ncbi:MAG: hypothetical protein KBT20_06035 [Bacteroidales bacterium]|nr:hypothetical protein [Candidatus Liminaster caballi]
MHRLLPFLTALWLCLPLPVMAQQTCPTVFDDLELEDADYEIVTPDSLLNVSELSDSVQMSRLERLMGVRLDTLTAILTICPDLPSQWDGHELLFSTPDFDFSRSYHDSVAVWYFMGEGDFFESYDSIVVCVPSDCVLSGELDDTEGICFLPAEVHRDSLLAALDKAVRAKGVDVIAPGATADDSKRSLRRQRRREAKATRRAKKKQKTHNY